MTDPAPVTTEAPAAPTAASPEPVDYSAHPVWGEALAPIPEVLRGPLLDTIRSTEAETQKAIEKARVETVPAEWRELAAEAQQMGVSVEELAAAYRGQSDLSKWIQEDPDKFLADMQAHVEGLIAAGTITRRQGADALRGAANAAANSEQADDLLTDDQRKIRELTERLDRQETQAQERARQEQEQRDAQAYEQQLEAEAQQFFDEFDRQMIAGGLAVQQGGRVVASGIAPETLQYVAEFAGSLLDRNPRLTHADAIQKATAHVKQQIEASGGKFGGGPAAPAATPVIGGSAVAPAAGAAAAAAAGPRTDDQRAADALAEVMRMRATD